MGIDERGAVANRLRIARRLAGLSQGQVAQILGCQRPTVTEMEAGRRKVSVEELVALAQAYGVSVEWLAKGPANQNSQADVLRIAARKLESMRPEELNQVIELLSLIEEQRRDEKSST